MARKKKYEETRAQTDKKQETPVKVSKNDGHLGVIDRDTVSEAEAKFEKYKGAKSPLENRIQENHDWFKGRYATLKDPKSGAYNEPDAKSAWAFNSIINKHADAMDNIPTANILPREESDQKAAERLSKIVPLIMTSASSRRSTTMCGTTSSL